MDLPQFLPMLDSIKCPVCRERIGMHLVGISFHCPHCRRKLHANVNRAFLEGAAVFLIVFGTWVAGAFLLDAEMFGLAGSIAAVVIFYIAYFLYRWRLAVRA